MKQCIPFGSKSVPCLPTAELKEVLVRVNLRLCGQTALDRDYVRLLSKASHMYCT